MSEHRFFKSPVSVEEEPLVPLPRTISSSQGVAPGRQSLPSPRIFSRKERAMPMPKDLKQFLSCLCTAEHVPRPDNEEWSAMIARISVPGRIADIDEEAYFYFLEVLPPKFMGGGCFAFAEGAEPFRFFW